MVCRPVMEPGNISTQWSRGHVRRSRRNVGNLNGYSTIVASGFRYWLILLSCYILYAGFDVFKHLVDEGELLFTVQLCLEHDGATVGTRYCQLSTMYKN